MNFLDTDDNGREVVYGLRNGNGTITTGARDASASQAPWYVFLLFLLSYSTNIYNENIRVNDTRVEQQPPRHSHFSDARKEGPKRRLSSLPHPRQ